ncbi:MAG: Hsp20/alpha crystallin family protein [Sulfuricaulis sp.]|nr:Hsp20/alpha crystallin family protein [Sulfuricaulis sp.]
MATTVPVKRVPETRTGETMRPLGVFEEMEQLAERMLPLSWMRPLHTERLFWGGAIPQVDIIDREAELVVRAAVPGFDKDDIEVSSTADAVTLRGCAEAEEKEGEEEGEYYRHEIRCEDFLRTIHLPCLVDDTRAKATFKDGMLELILPKAEAAKRHTVKIEEA